MGEDDRIFRPGFGGGFRPGFGFGGGFRPGFGFGGGFRPGFGYGFGGGIIPFTLGAATGAALSRPYPYYPYPYYPYQYPYY